jgi:hypothetical protein
MERLRLALLLLLLIFLFHPAMGRTRTEAWTAWVSDESCGAMHTKAGGADCIRKCKRGGASVGHPEWQPQRTVLVKESDKSVWFVENPEALEGREGERLVVKVTVHRTANSVHVRSFAPATEGSTP